MDRLIVSFLVANSVVYPSVGRFKWALSQIRMPWRDFEILTIAYRQRLVIYLYFCCGFHELKLVDKLSSFHRLMSHRIYKYKNTLPFITLFTWNVLGVSLCFSCAVMIWLLLLLLLSSLISHHPKFNIRIVPFDCHICDGILCRPTCDDYASLQFRQGQQVWVLFPSKLKSFSIFLNRERERSMDEWASKNNKMDDCEAIRRQKRNESVIFGNMRSKEKQYAHHLTKCDKVECSSKLKCYDSQLLK